MRKTSSECRKTLDEKMERLLNTSGPLYSTLPGARVGLPTGRDGDFFFKLDFSPRLFIGHLSADGGYTAPRNAAVDEGAEIEPPRCYDEPGAARQTRSSLKTVRNISLRVLRLIYEQMELVLHITLYKLHVIYTTLIEPMIAYLLLRRRWRR